MPSRSVDKASANSAPNSISKLLGGLLAARNHIDDLSKVTPIAHLAIAERLFELNKFPRHSPAIELTRGS